MMDDPELKKDYDAEQRLIGCLLHAGRQSDVEYIELIFDGVSEHDFFEPKFRAIFAVVKAMRSAGEQLDPQLVSRKCRIKEPAAEILEALESVTGCALAPSFMGLVCEASRQRQVVLAANDAKQLVTTDPKAAVQVLQDRLDALKQSEQGRPLVTGAQATESYLRFLGTGDRTLIRGALPELDYSLGGGVDYGEMVILAARPSHGKTAIALQSAHNWTADGLPTLYVSLEMSASALGKRILQYSSSVPEESWRRDMQDLRCDVEKYHDRREDLFIADNLKTLDQIVSEIERSVKQRGIKAVVVDYAQLIQSPGKTRYEQITHTSTVLRGLASEHRIVMLVLCQMSREIEARKKFIPIMSDIKESGQFEQDADVVVFLVWPHRIDSQQPAHEYQFFIAKNRNRPILTSAFTARFEPSRQRVVSPRVRDMPNYEPAFAEHDPFDFPE